MIVTDSGGTSYDVSLVRRGDIPWTAEAWIGLPFDGHMVGLPAVEVQCIGAGGGSIAKVDEAGLLSVGPKSAGADPGPACYGRGGSYATVTDAALALRYLDPLHFLGGRVPLDLRAAGVRDRPGGRRGAPAGPPPKLRRRSSIWPTERMVGAIEDMTVSRGIDPAGAVLVGGGGSAGFQCRRHRAPARLLADRDPQHQERLPERRGRASIRPHSGVSCRCRQP